MRSEEAALLAAWSRENLEAYGAALRADGDPRGELIALDLALEHATSRAAKQALAEEKQAIHVGWLGDVGENVISRFGFVEEIRDELEHVLLVFDTVVPYLRDFDFAGEVWQTREIMRRIAAVPRPWLGSLRICAFTDTQETCVDDALAAELIAATPNLTRLVVDGHCICGDIPHPRVTELVVRGHDAIGALRGAGTMPNVRQLEVTLHPNQFIHREPAPQALRDGWIPRSGFPALEILDLAGNEPCARTREPNCYGGQTAFFDVLPRIAILPHVRELRLPSVRTPAQRQRVQEALAQTTALRRCEVRRSYGEALPVPGCVVAAPVAWPAADALRTYDALLVHLDGAWQRAELAQAYEICERRFAAMTAAQQRAWSEVWTLAGALGTASEERTLTFPIDYLVTAAEVADEDQHEWYALADALAGHTGDLEVRRIDGFPEGTDEPAPARVAATGARIDEHERALQAHWDLDRLAVYADELLERGDIRGELIALDLRILREGDPDGDLELERDDLHERVFGESYSVTSQLGFTRIDVAWAADEENTLAGLLKDDVARYVREIELAGVARTVERDLRYVLREPRPWLRALRVETMGELEQRHVDWPNVAREWPSLEELELAFDEPTTLFAGFTHPRVTSLRLTQLAALAALGEPWPAVATLDIAFGDADATEVTRLLTHARFPALRVLDLSRNELQTGDLDREHRFQGPENTFDILARIDPALLARLTELRVPSLRTPSAVLALQRALDGMPALERCEIVRRYRGGPELGLHHPRATVVVPQTSPWPPLDAVGQGAAVEIADVVVPLRGAVRAMEKRFEALAEPGRAAWTTLWHALEDPARTLQIKAADVYTAMAELEERDAYAHEWAAKLVTALHSLALADATVRVRRRETAGDA